MQPEASIIESIKTALETSQNPHGLTVSGIYKVVFEDFGRHLDRETIQKHLDVLNRLGVVAFQAHRIGPFSIPRLHYKIQK